MMDRWVMKGEKGWGIGGWDGVLNSSQQGAGFKVPVSARHRKKKKKRETKKNELQADMLCKGKQWGERGPENEECCLARGSLSTFITSVNRGVVGRDE